MNKKISLLLTMLFSVIIVFAQEKDPETTELWEPVPPKVTPGENGAPPSDALVLFDGKDLTNFESVNGGAAKWKVEDGFVTVVPKTGAIRTKQSFSDCQLHIEWRSPIGDDGEGQGKGNSGIFLMGKYELQVLDSYESKTYSNGQAGSIYKQHIPLVNACKNTGEWQTYDVIFTAPKFGESGRMVFPARITVLHNGVLIQNNVAIWGGTQFIGSPYYKEHENKLPLMLQDHTDLVSFRNIWIREL